MKKAPKLSNEERSEIQILKEKGYSIRSIAKVLGRSPNTISYELKNNSMKKTGEYIAVKAKHKAYVKRKYAKYQGMKIQDDDELRRFIISKLELLWNPDEIAGFMRVNPELGFYASKTAIYDWLRSAYGQKYCSHLYSKRYNKKPRPENKTKRQMIPDRVSIHDRPAEVELKNTVGHLEFDSVVSAKPRGKPISTYALAVVTERVTRLVGAAVVSNLRPAAYAGTIMDLVNNIEVKSLTTDNGIENKHHRQITNNTGAVVYFADPYASYQKGGVENSNKMLRRFFPKGTDFANITQTELNKALELINNKPRKILGYKSSIQVAKEKGLFKESVLIEG